MANESTIVEVTRWFCTECKKLHDEPVDVCTCQTRNKEGKIVGPFKLLEQAGGRWKCECLLCTNIKEVHVSNLKRQSSCGCLPRHIQILGYNDAHTQVRYRCGKCGQTVKEDLPVLCWCHTEDSEEDE